MQLKISDVYVFNRFRRTGPVRSSDKLKRLSFESKSARDFRRLGFKSTSPFNSMKWIADEPLSATKTTPLVKHRSRASLNTSLRTFTSTGRCKSSSTRLSRVEIVVQRQYFALGPNFKCNWSFANTTLVGFPEAILFRNYCVDYQTYPLKYI